MRLRRRTGSPVWTRAGATFAVLIVCVAVVLAADLARYADLGPFDRGGAFDGDWRWVSNRDSSYAELLGYAVVAAAAGLLVRLAVRHGTSRLYLAWAAVLAAVVVDDAARLHERGGRLLADVLPLPTVLGLRPTDVGELLTWAGIAGPLLALVVAAHVRAEPRGRSHSLRLGGLVGVLGGFGVVLDMAHSATSAQRSDRNDFLLRVVEAGGELGAMCALLSYAVHLSSGASRPRPSTAG